MRRSIWLAGLVLVLAAGCASVNVEEERTALMQRDREFAQATKDVDRFVSFFAADARAYAPGMPVVSGTENIRKMVSEMMAAPGFSLSFEPNRAEVAASGDIGVTTGTYTSAAGGVKETGKYVTVWKKDAGTWKVTDDIFNADAAPAMAAPAHAMVQPGSLVWADPPPGLPAGGKVAVLSGDPSKAEPFVLRAQIPAGYPVPLHWHPTTENLTVLSGTVSVGMADGSPTDLPAGGMVVLPAEMRHVFSAKTAATIQVHGIGPFGITYVNPADDPRNKK
jgi:ketosteroid isomerase-like protein